MTYVEGDPLEDLEQIKDSTLVLEHDRIPFISYPYEWTFEMLRDAAVLHLEVPSVTEDLDNLVTALEERGLEVVEVRRVAGVEEPAGGEDER